LKVVEVCCSWGLSQLQIRLQCRIAFCLRSADDRRATLNFALHRDDHLGLQQVLRCADTPYHESALPLAGAAKCHYEHRVYERTSNLPWTFISVFRVVFSIASRLGSLILLQDVQRRFGTCDGLLVLTELVSFSDECDVER
jgi:hypothetical protein